MKLHEQQLEALCSSTTTSDIEARCKLEESFLIIIDDHETIEEKCKSAGNTVRYLSALYIMYRVYVYKNGI